MTTTSDRYTGETRPDAVLRDGGMPRRRGEDDTNMGHTLLNEEESRYNVLLTWTNGQTEALGENWAIFDMMLMH